jgi:hypothetical protein
MHSLLALMLLLQGFSQRGFVEGRGTVYPQEAANDSANTVGELLFRHESFYSPRQDVQFAAAVDLRTDTHRQSEREWRLDWADRSLQRPALSIRRLSAQWYRGGFSVEAGKQFVRWGKTDIINPTDRFAPRDFLTVADNEFLGIAAVRGIYERGSNTLDVVWAPRLTPSRLPLARQRWVVTPESTFPLPVNREIAEGSQAGIRWSHLGRVEFAAAYYHGFDHFPSFELTPVSVHQFYPKLRMAGGDVAVPLRWMTVKGEAGYFNSPGDSSDDYLLYVIQLERQTGEWFFVGGYGGEWVANEAVASADFNPDRGRLRTLLGRAGYTIDPNRSVAAEAAVRQDFDGALLKGEYSQAFGQHWRVTAAFTLIRGEPADFLGQYRRNSHGLIVVKYSF